MTFRDSYRISLHTIKENKSRSFLTVVISMFLSTLIMGLLCIAVSFSSNGNEILNRVYFGKDSYVSSNYICPYIPQLAGQQEVFNIDKYDTFLSALNKNKETVEMVDYQINVSQKRPAFVTDSTYKGSSIYKVIEGRDIEPSSDIDEVVVSSSYYEASLTSPEPYSIGSVHKETVEYSRELPAGGVVIREAEINYKVVGIYTGTSQEYRVDGRRTSRGYTVVPDMVFDVKVFLKASPEIYVSRANMYYLSNSDSTNVASAFSSIEKLMKDIDEVMPPRIEPDYGGPVVMYNPVSPTSSAVFQEYQQLTRFQIIFIVAGSVIAIALLLMSVGSLANSVIISIDRSKKFFGLLKALGLKGRELITIVIMESITLISIGVILGYALLFAFTAPLNMISHALANTIYSRYMMMISYEATIQFPVYILFIGVALFVITTLLFARSSLVKISKTDPIAVISEVS